MSTEDYSIEFLRTAVKELSKLPLEVQQTIVARIDDLKINPYPPDVKTLKNSDGRLRLRVGDYRVIYRVEANQLIIIVIKVGHRKNIYKK